MPFAQKVRFYFFPWRRGSSLSGSHREKLTDINGERVREKGRREKESLVGSSLPSQIMQLRVVRPSIHRCVRLLKVKKAVLNGKSYLHRSARTANAIMARRGLEYKEEETWLTTWVGNWHWKRLKLEKEARSRALPGVVQKGHRKSNQILWRRELWEEN